MQYTQHERVVLVALAVVGFAGLNGVFVWALVSQPQALSSALTNPVAAAFIAEAFVLMGLLAYLLTRWRVTALHWGWFVLLSLVAPCRSASLPAGGPIQIDARLSAPLDD